jgi:plasmid stabilization system protein ParE
MGEKRLLEWSIRSSANVADIRDYIAYDNPQAAQNVLGEIRRVANSLCASPMLGHVGRRAGTRELAITRYPYLIVYRLSAKKVHILAVAHQSRRYPS